MDSLRLVKISAVVDMMHLYWFSVRSWFIGSSALAVHLLIVFYARDFVWDDLAPKQAVEKFSSYYHQNYTSCCKWLVSYVVMATCRCGLVSTHQGQLLIVLQAIPQLVRSKGVRSQQLRVVMGPLTPMLAINNLCRNCQTPICALQCLTCFLAFVVLRPDNTSVLDLVGCSEALQPYLGEYKMRRKLHGTFAACNAALAFLSLMKEVDYTPLLGVKEILLY